MMYSGWFQSMNELNFIKKYVKSYLETPALLLSEKKVFFSPKAWETATQSWQRVLTVLLKELEIRLY